MSDEQNTQPTEREELEARATQLGIQFSPKIGDEKLRERVNEALNGQDPQGDGEDSGDEDGPAPAAKAAEPANESDKARRARKQREAAALVRVQVTCMNPNKREYDGELICAGNNVVGTFKKYVKFDVEYHVPRIIFNVLRDRECQVFVTEKDDKGRSIRRGKQIKEFNVVELPALSEKELKELAQRQAMREGQAAA